MGLTEQLVFPEIDPDKVKFTQGMDITFVTSTDNDDEARELLRLFGMPFREDVNDASDPMATHVAQEPQSRYREARMATEAKNVRFRKQLASWKPASATPDKVKMPPRELHPHSPALPDLRPAAGGVSQVRHLPDLFPQPGQRWPDSGRQESELVRDSDHDDRSR